MKERISCYDRVKVVSYTDCPGTNDPDFPGEIMLYDYEKSIRDNFLFRKGIVTDVTETSLVIQFDEGQKAEIPARFCKKV